MSPVYEYQCPICGKVDEYFQHMSDEDMHRTCHTCVKPMKRIISTPSSPRGFKLEYSHALGKYVKNKEDFKDGLKKIDADWQLVIDQGEY